MDTQKKLPKHQQEFMINVELIMRQIESKDFTMEDGYGQLLALYRDHLRENKIVQP